MHQGGLNSGVQPKQDLIELWKRIVFNMAVSNTDDHLRNHAFIFAENGWRLSPLYDVNPIPFWTFIKALWKWSKSMSLIFTKTPMMNVSWGGTSSQA